MTRVKINQHVNSKLGGIHSARLLINSIDYTDLASLAGARDYAGMTRLLCKSGRDLKAANAEALVLCANVAHKAADALEKTTGLRVLHIVDSTAPKIVSRGIKKVGLLATRAVMEEEDFYVSRLQKKFGLEVVVPDGEFRSKADRMIFEEMNKEEIPETVKSTWRSAYASLVKEHQVGGVILGCTELRLVFRPQDLTAPTFETTTLHAKAISEWALGGKID
ncbi:hypothetical protein LTS17_000257 [Exophiala oligosperma]